MLEYILCVDIHYFIFHFSQIFLLLVAQNYLLVCRGLD